MKKNIQLDINHIVSHEATHLQRVELLKQILFEDMTDKEGVKVLKEILEDYKQTEQEFEQRPLIINAFSLLIGEL